jgi:hypothetical protein
MLIRVEQGKGGKGRYVMLPPPTVPDPARLLAAGPAGPLAVPGWDTSEPVSVARNCTISSALSTTGSFGSRATTMRSIASVQRVSEVALTSADAVISS